MFIAFRYLKARRRGVFTLLTSIIGIGGITLGVASLIITLAVMSGFHKDIKERILRLQPHLVVIKENSYRFNDYKEIEQEISKNKEVNSSAPFVYGQIILRNADNTSGAVIKGIDWQKENKVVDIKGLLTAPKTAPETLRDDEIVLGKELADKLRLRLGNDVILMSPGQFAVIPKMKKFKVAGIFHSGMFEYDDNLAYITLATSQELFDMKDSATGIGVSLKNINDASKLEKYFQGSLSYPYGVRSWEKMNRNLFAALKLEKIMMFIILTLIILVASFNIISNLLLLTVEKAKEIGILSAMGLERHRIGKIFFYEGIIIGVTGILSGLILGVGISLILKKYQFIHLPADIYYLDALPVRLLPGDVLSVALAALLITLVAVIYPAYQATKLDPIETIRYG